MSLTLVTPPALEPLTVADVRNHLRLGSSAGEPAPTAPTVALASPAAAGNSSTGAHRVGFTFVTAEGETELGPLSDVVTIVSNAVNGKIDVTAIALGGAAVTARRAYLVPVAGGSALFAATINNNSDTTLTLNVADGSLGVAAPTVNTTSDPEIRRLIRAVRRRCEHATRRALITQTWDQYLDTWPLSADGSLLPAGGWVELQKPPLQTVTYVTYTDLAGVEQTWDPTNYLVDAPAGDYCRRGRLSLGWVKVWPIARPTANSRRIRTVCGYGASANSVPDLLLQGMLLDTGTLYDIRGAVLAGSRAAAIEIPSTTKDIYLSFRSL